MSLSSDALSLEHHFSDLEQLAKASWRDATGAEFTRRHLGPLHLLAQDYRREAERFERDMEAALREMP